MQSGLRCIVRCCSKVVIAKKEKPPGLHKIEYEKYNEALTKVDDLRQWYAESSDESDTERIVNTFKNN